MTLAEYINSHPRSERRALRERIAAHCDVTEPAVRHWANGTRGLPVAKAIRIQELTGNDLTIADLVPGVGAALANSAA